MKNNINININLEENKIILNSKENISIRIEIFDYNFYTNDIKLIYIFNDKLSKNINHWYSPSSIMKNMYGILVKIYKDDYILKTEKFRLKTKFGVNIKKQALVIHSYGGMGDNIICSSIIRKLYNLYNQKITVCTYYPEVFINNPYIENIIKITNSDVKLNSEIYEIHNIWHTYNLPFNTINRSCFNKNSNSGWLASQISLGLEDDELLLDFFPDDYNLEIDLPDNYIVINPNITSPAKTWGYEKWQKFVNLIQEHIPVVALGRQSDLMPEKTYINNIEIKNGINLINKTDLSQAWHIINKSHGIITHNSGLYCLSLTTDSKIFELGSHTKPFYYKGDKNNDINIILGECNKFCIEDLSFYISEHGTINTLIYSRNCPIYNEFKCHPSPEKVFEFVISKINI